MSLVVSTPWFSAHEPDHGTFFLLSYVDRNLCFQRRYAWSVPKHEFYARVKQSHFNPWKFGLPKDPIVFPMLMSPREFEKSIILRTTPNQTKVGPLFDLDFHRTCPMQQVVGTFQNHVHQVQNQVHQVQNHVHQVQNHVHQVCGAILESVPIPSSGRSLTIIPTHDYLTVSPNALFDVHQLRPGWEFQSTILISEHLYYSYWHLLTTQAWDEVVLDRLELKASTEFLFPHTKCIWIITKEEIGDIVHALMYIYQLQYDIEYGLEHVIDTISKFKCLRAKRTPRKNITVLNVLPPLEGVINGKITREITEQVIIPMSIGERTSPTAIQLRITQLNKLPMPPTHYLDMTLALPVSPLYQCELCLHPIQFPTRNWCCDHYFCYPCMNNHCIGFTECPTCDRTFVDIFYRGDDRDCDIQFRYIAPERHYLPEGDFDVIVRNLQLVKHKGTVFFSCSFDYTLISLHQALQNLDVPHQLITSCQEEMNSDQLVLMPSWLLLFYKSLPIKHLIGARFHPRYKKILTHNFAKTKLTLLV